MKKNEMKYAGLQLGGTEFTPMTLHLIPNCANTGCYQDFITKGQSESTDEPIRNQDGEIFLSTHLM